MTANAAQNELDIQLSQVDEDRFGIRTARTLIESATQLPAVMDFCQQQGVKFLIARCPTTAIHAAHAVEREGFELMDTLVYYQRDLIKVPLPEKPELPLVRGVQPADAESVRSVAADSFKGYFGHYHADPRLDPVKCDEGYVEWAVNSCLSRAVADEVLIAEADGQILGFATLRVNTPNEGEGVLFGVSPAAQGQGYYRTFIIHALHWGAARQMKQIVVSTQVTNIAVQKVWARLGFEMHHSYYTFHKWFD